jgi:hypothetical protein
VKFQAGDLVTYKDQFTSSGNFDGAQALLVLKTMIPRTSKTQRVFVHNLKKGIQGWDFAFGYVKMPVT